MDKQPNWEVFRKKPYHKQHLTEDQKKVIEKLLEAGWPVKEIVRLLSLNLNITTIYRIKKGIPPTS